MISEVMQVDLLSVLESKQGLVFRIAEPRMGHVQFSGSILQIYCIDRTKDMGIILSQGKPSSLRPPSISSRSNRNRYSRVLCSRSWSQIQKMIVSCLHRCSIHHCCCPNRCLFGCLDLPCDQLRTQLRLHPVRQTTSQASIPEADLCHMCSFLAVLGSRTAEVGHHCRHFHPILHHRRPSLAGCHQQLRHLQGLDPTGERR